MIKSTLRKILLIVTTALLLLSSCAEKKPSITIAEQYGLAYAPLEIMKRKGFLKELAPEADIRWVKLANTAAIREAVLAGDVDAGFMGIPPFLIARDHKMPWKIATGLSQSPLGLVVSYSNIQTVDDFTDKSRIALPQPGSIQHILLSMALKKSHDDHAHLDSLLVSMKHPDGMAALLSGVVDGHFTSPPYLFHETDNENFHQLISGEEAMGEPFTFIVGAVTEEFYQNQPELYQHYLTAIGQAIDYINQHPAECAEILSVAYNMDRLIIEDYLSRPGMVYETEVRGVETFIEFMNSIGMIDPTSEEEVFF